MRHQHGSPPQSQALDEQEGRATTLSHRTREGEYAPLHISVLKSLVSRDTLGRGTGVLNVCKSTVFISHTQGTELS